MAPSKRRMQRSREAHWTSDDDFEMLAYLEHCRRSDTEGNLFKRTVAQHLKLKLGKSYEFDQVDCRLADLWTDHGVGESSECSNHSLVYQYGAYSFGFVKYDRTMQKRLSRRLQQMEKEQPQNVAERRCRSRIGREHSKLTPGHDDTRPLAPLSEEGASDQDHAEGHPSSAEGEDLMETKARVKSKWLGKLLPTETILMDWYDRKLRKVRQIEEGLRDEIHAAENAIAYTERMDQAETTRCLQQYIFEVRQLKSRSRERSALHKFTKGTYRVPQQADRQSFVNEMCNIQHEIESVAIVSDLSHLREIIMSDIAPSYPDLCEGFLGSNQQVVEQAPAQCLLQSIISTAICRWVFEDEFRPLCMEAGFLANTILDMLQITDGEEVVTNLQFASHDALIRTDYFRQHLIPKLAKEKTKRLWRILKPAFCNEGITEPAVENVQQPQSKKEIKRRLKTIFESAYTIRALTIITMMDFQVIRPSPDMAYDPVFMQSENRGKAAYKQENVDTNGEHITIVTTPGLVWCPPESATLDYGPIRRLGDHAPLGFDVLERSHVWSHVVAQP